MDQKKKIRSLSRKKEEERREQFISIISHQLRTPLSIVRGYLEALEDEDMGKFTGGQKEYLAGARQINANMIDLVNRYLDVLSKDSASIKVHTEKFSLSEFLQDIAKNFSSYAKATNVEFALHLPKKDTQITSDPQLLRNAINNIIQNSIKYTIGSGTITLTVHAGDINVSISISDTGIGIPKNQHDQVFTKFFRGKNIIHRSIAGSGLGLYIAREYITALHGKIGFTSEEGRGTEVTITLPLH
ncbi:MAG: HAMP domain-containing sensor histidine kinase [Patescibacteria group bacterium]|jgi:two-component system sensor histidine kinase VicK